MAELRWPVRPAALLAWAGMLIVLSGCGTPRPDPRTLRPGTHFQITPIHYHWSTRTYLLHVPRNYDEQRAWPFVLVLHGAFGTAARMEKCSNFSTLADREGFVVAYPNGIGFFGFLQHWNAGHCCGLAAEDHVDDVGFLRYVMDDVSNRLHIDPQRVYVVGHSNGGMLAYQFASLECARIAAVGVVAGALGSAQGAGKPLRKVGPPQTPVPLIVIHGREDHSVPFPGGTGFRPVGRRYLSVLDSAEGWAGYCGCEPSPDVDEDACAGHRILTWRDVDGNPWVVLHILSPWGHEWPARACLARRLPQGHPLRTFEACEIIRDFFRARSLSRSMEEAGVLRSKDRDGPGAREAGTPRG
jgi:polyhydroxybutyrate depolymerase